MSIEKIGFIGVGNLGMPMARSLLKSGFRLTVYDIRPEAVEKMRALGAIGAKSCRDVALACEIIISMVYTAAQTDDVFFGKDGVWQGLKKGSIIILTSTLAPSYCRELYSKAKKKGAQVIDCAVTDPSGQRHRMGSLTLMIGGDKGAVGQCRPIFEALGKHIYHMGGIGMGQTCKLVHQINAFNVATITRESLNLGLKAGLDFKKMVEALSNGRGSTKGLQHMAARLRSLKPAPASGAITKRASGPGVGMNKDSELALEMAEEIGVNMPIARFMAELDTTSEYEAYSKEMRKYAI